MSYLVLARRWRPQRFSELVGQDVVVKTLKNSLVSGNLAHAYLLCGIRGVGKTTIARLMAMAVNCEHPEQGEPCGACAACKGILDSSNLDVQEMDAASHTGVDDVREILDGVRYPPNSLKIKVYIIDEAHMLSKSAFNALLKTLEEPPARVMFILATTESDKLPITVRSRCQRFDLRRLGWSEISEYLQHVFEKEKMSADKDALAALAQAADGSVRDALSLAERVLAFNGEHLSLDAVQSALGMVGNGVVRELAEHIFAGSAERAMMLLRDALSAGHAPRSLLLELARLWHRLACALVDTEFLQDGSNPQQTEWLTRFTDRITYPTLDLRYQVLLTGLRDLSLVDERIGAEMIVIRLCGLNDIAAISAAISCGGNKGSDDASDDILDSGAVEDNRGDNRDALAAAPVVRSPKRNKPAVKLAEGESGDAVEQVGKNTESSGATEEPDLPLHEATVGVKSYTSWQEAIDAFASVRAGVAAMLDHVVCLEFAEKVRLALDKHQQRAIAPADRLAFAEWLGREVLWEARQSQDGESLSQERAKQAKAETARLRKNAENDPHVQALMKEMDAQLVKVTPAGVDVQTGDDN